MNSVAGMIFQRIFNKITMTFAVMVFVFYCSGADDSGLKFEKLEIVPGFYDIPSSKVSGVPGNFSPRLKFEHKWLVIRIDFQPDAPKETYLRRNRKNRYHSPQMWFDDVNLSVRVLLDIDKGAKISDVKRVMFTGNCTFWAIKRDGKKHVALMFLPAQLIDRFSSEQIVVTSSRKGRTNVDTRTSRKSVRDFTIEAVFTCKGRELGRCYYNLKGKPAAQQKEFNKAAGDAEKSLPGSLLSRANSPWALFEPSQFDVEKTSNSAK